MDSELKTEYSRYIILNYGVLHMEYAQWILHSVLYSV